MPSVAGLTLLVCACIEAPVPGATPSHVHGIKRGGVSRYYFVQGEVGPAYRIVGGGHLEGQGRNLRLVPGMQVSAEIHLGTRTVLEYLLSSVQKIAIELC